MDPLLEHAYVKSPTCRACIICNTVCHYNHSDFRQRKIAKPCRCEFLYPKLASTLAEILETTITADRTRFACQACSHEIAIVSQLKQKLCEAEQKLKSRISSEGYIEQNKEELQEEQEDEQEDEEEDEEEVENVKQRVRVTFKDVVITRIKHSCYRSAFRLAIKRSKRARRAAVRFVGDMASQEMKCFVKKAPRLLAVSQIDQSTAEEFDWRDVIRVFKSKLPVLYTALCYSLTKRGDRRKVKIRRGSCGRLIAGLGLILGMVARMRCNKFNVIPGLVGICLWKMGCKQKLFKTYSRTGLCCADNTSRKILKCCSKDFDPGLMPGKSSLEESADSSDMDDDGGASDSSQYTDDSDASDTSHSDDVKASDASSHSDDSEA